MQTSQNNPSPWPTVRFPNRGQRRRFLDHVALWNNLEDLPSITAEPLIDGVGVRLRFGETARRGMLRLIESCGGRFSSEATC
jgi:hypothetical protein